MRVLLVEDDLRIARFVAKGLREQAYAVDVVSSGEEALYQSEINTYDLVILDVLIPPPDGFAVCSEMRKSGKRVPILMLTARDAVEDRITGLDQGADDYLTKPFEFRELLARLRALLRRTGSLQPARRDIRGYRELTAHERPRRAQVLSAKRLRRVEARCWLRSLLPRPRRHRSGVLRPTDGSLSLRRCARSSSGAVPLPRTCPNRSGPADGREKCCRTTGCRGRTSDQRSAPTARSTTTSPRS